MPRLRASRYIFTRAAQIRCFASILLVETTMHMVLIGSQNQLTKANAAIP